MDARGITKGRAVGLIVIVIVGVIIAAGYVLLSGGGEKTAELEVGNLVFCSGETRSYGMYDEQPDNTYSKEEFDKIYVYAEVDNLGTEPAKEEGVFRTWLVVDPVVKQDGDVVDDPIEKGKIIKFEEETIKRGLYVQRALNIRDIPPGTYTLELEIKDQYSKDKETLTGRFTLVD